tara:strand:- start:11 stop:229 length:219 start_codon:yes stop_codon:yes gene_type:complete
MQVRSYSRTCSYVYHWHLVNNELFKEVGMGNPLKTWFFELIEDAIGSKAMKQFNKEEEAKKDSKSKRKKNEK